MTPCWQLVASTSRTTGHLQALFLSYLCDVKSDDDDDDERRGFLRPIEMLSIDDVLEDVNRTYVMLNVK